MYFVGFTPGLPYMTGMPERINIPRLVNPRTKTPPGSVAIGGVQCCIYSVESPGGFWVLGRTPVRLYDPTAEDPILLRAGDHVRFRPIERAEYDAIAAEVAAGRWRPAHPPSRQPRVTLLVQDAGPLTTVQDLGRMGHLRVGIPRSGPMDREAFVLANRLVGNPDAPPGSSAR